jgi:hypothetical protein
MTVGTQVVIAMTETLEAGAVLVGTGMTGTLLLALPLAVGTEPVEVPLAEGVVTAPTPVGVEVARPGQLVTVGAQEVMVTSSVS